MDFASYVDELTEQNAAMRAAVVAAGPGAPVPTCPEWTVERLVRHLAKVQSWVMTALVTAPDAGRPAPGQPPRDWDGLLAYWDGQSAGLTGRLRERGPDAPAWVFTSAAPATSAFWARRQAHEVAIHRLDAEHAVAGSAALDAVPTLVFGQELAEDGIDEALHVAITNRWLREPVDVTGSVLFHAADAGRAWLVRLRPGQPLDIGPATEPAIDAGATVAGTADAVYRAVWGRPSTAVTGGDRALIDALRAP